MAKITVTLKEWLDYLDSRVDIDVYVWGGNGQTLVSLLPKLCDMEKADHTWEEALKNTGKILALVQKRLLRDVSIYVICGEDCSGLGVKFLLSHKIIDYDMTANSLWEYIVGTKKKKGHGKQIPLTEVRAGDYVFDGTDKNKWHIGYATSEKYAVESKSHKDGVCKTIIADRDWKYAARPNWYEGDEPEPVKPVLTRELYLKDPYMRGDDVKEVQARLNELGYNCGEIDGIFGRKCDIATKNFQQDNNLTVDGIVGKKTAEALGFKWEG